MNKLSLLRRLVVSHPRHLPLVAALLLAGSSGSLRAQVPGGLDPAYQPPVLDQGAQAVVIQPDKKALLGGSFTTYDGASVNPLIRLNADGTLDTTFAASAGILVPREDADVNALLLQADGKIVASAYGTTTGTPTLTRLNADGTLDPSFTTSLPDGGVLAMAVQADGKIVVTGQFYTIDNTACTGIARLNADGSIDTSFAPAPAPANASGVTLVQQGNALLIQPDGKIVLAGSVNTTSGVVYALLRLNADGSQDTSFPTVFPNSGGSFQSLALQADGKIVASGTFTSINGVAVPNIARFSGVDGSLDQGFAAGVAFGVGFNQLAVQADGKILASNNVGGGVTLVRLNPDGSIDRDYAPGFVLSQSTVTALALQPDGLGVVSGTLILPNPQGNQPNVSIARLLANATSGLATLNLVVPGTAKVWLAANGAVDQDGYGDTVVNAEPVRVTGLTLTPGATLSFSATGLVNNNYGDGNFAPDGDAVIESASTQNGLSGVTASGDSLLGVFIDDSAADPTNANAPARLDFSGSSGSVPGGQNYPTLSPLLGQVFFIGDGKTSGGVTQQVTVPAGATHLVFGAMDYGFWHDNSGAFNVTISTSTGTGSVPLAATTLTVDGSNKSTPVPKGEAITFTATQGAVSSSIYVRVQATMTPTVESSWTDLADTTNGGAGFLQGDGSGHYTLKTKQYPFGPGIYFRAISAESGQPDSISNVVGGFNLESANAPGLFITETGSTADDPNANVAIIGDQITYTLKVYNDGPPTANNVKVIIEVPAGQQLVSIDDSYSNSSLGDYLVDVGSLNPTGNSPLLLHVVTQVNSTANLGQVFSGLGYSVSADGGAFAQGTDLVKTTVVRPLEVIVTSNSASVSPGQPLVFQITINNRTASAVKNVALSIPIPGTVNYNSATLTDDSGKTLLGPVKNGVPTYPVNPVINGTNLLAYLGNIAAGAKDHLTITVTVPYDVAPGAAITLGGPQVTTKTPVGDSNSFTLPDTAVTLSSQPPANPPHFTLFKFIPDGLSLFQIIAENANAAAFLDAAFPGLATLTGLQDLGKAINPNILDTTDEDGNYEQAVSAPGQSGGPAVTRITYALIFSNDGGIAAPNVVLTDRIPAGTTFDGSSTYAPTFNGAPFASGKVTLDPDGHTLHFNLGTIKPDKFAASGALKKPSLGLVLYTVDVLPNNQGGPSLGAAVQAQGGTLSTSVLLHTTEAQPNEIDTVVTAPGAAYLESYKGTAQAMIGHEIPYDIFYENTGGTKPTDFLITDPLPAGTSFVSADLLDDNHIARTPVAGKESIDKLAVGATSGTVTFHLGKIKHGAHGFVRLVVKVENSALNVPGLLITNHPTVPASVFPGNPQRARTGPQPRDTRIVLQAPTAASNNAARLQILLNDPLAGLPPQPPIGRLDVGITVPMSVKEGSTYDCLVFAANTTDAVIHAEVIVPVPPGAEFVSAGDGPFKGIYLAPNTGAQPYVLFEPIVHDDADNLIEKDVAPHSAQLYRVTLRAKSGTAGQSLVTSVQTAAANYAAGANGVTVAPVYSSNVSTYVIGAAESFADAASQIVTAELETTGSSAATLGGAALQKRIAQLTPTTLVHSTGGTDLLALNNNVLVVPLGSGNALAVGPAANISAPGVGTSLIGQDGNGIVAQGGGNLITVQNLIGQDGNGIVAQGGGNLQSLLAGIVAQGGGNIVAQGGGNLLNLGGGNLFAPIGNSVISNDGGSLTLLNLTGIVAQGGGNIVAAGGGNIVAQGGGNIVAQGGGNIVAQGGGNIVAQGGGNIVAAGGGNLVSNSSGTLLSTDVSLAINLSGAGIVAAGGGNLVSNSSGTLVSNSSGTLVGTPGHSVASRPSASGNLIQGGSAAGAIGENSSGFTGTSSVVPAPTVRKQKR